MKLTNYDLDKIFSEAVRLFSNQNKPILMSDRQFRSLCHTQAVIDYLYAHGIVKDKINFTEERNVDSIFED
jgi:uncharacterized protein (DUF779 family)